MKINDLYLLRTVGTNTVLMNKQDPQKMVKLNETAAFILSKVANGLSEKEIALSLAGEYDVSSDQAEKDTQKALSDLMRLGIVEA